MVIDKALALPARFHSLDALRGLAALAVVFWHWQHFYFEGGRPPIDFDRTLQPLFSVFSTFYLRGWLAVDLFFTLSGFIFYWLYAESLAARRTTLGQFFWLRFSRLYPLHLVTLLLVAIGQAFHKAITGNYFVYQINDLYHFLLNLSLVSAWGLQRDHSFNGPIWSISIEVLLYIVFFVMCRSRFVRWYWLLAAASLGVLLLEGAHTYIGRGLLSFFVGGLSYMAYTRLRHSGHLVAFARLAAPGLVLMWTTIFVVAALPFQLFDPARENVNLGLICALALFPFTMVSLAAIETVRGNFVGPLAKVGDISYASYLLHFPLQLLIATIAAAAMMSPTIYYQPATLGVFFALLVAISFASYRWFERPMQNALRALLVGAVARRRVS